MTSGARFPRRPVAQLGVWFAVLALAGAVCAWCALTANEPRQRDEPDLADPENAAPSAQVVATNPGAQQPIASTAQPEPEPPQHGAPSAPHGQPERREARGRVVDALGQPRAASVRITEGERTRLPECVDTDAEGAYHAPLPSSWARVFVVATAAGGRSGSIDARLPRDATQPLPDIVLTRKIPIDLQLKLRALRGAAGGLPFAGTVHTELQNEPQDLHSRDVPIHAFACGGEESEYATHPLVIPGEQRRVQWAYREPGGDRLVLQQTLVPDDAERFDDTCSLDADMLLFGRAVDAGGQPVGGMTLVVDIAGPFAQRVALDTSPDGTFHAPVARGAHGTLQGRWCADVVPWRAGKRIEVPVDAIGHIRLQVLDGDRQVVRSYAASLHNEPRRDAKGEAVAPSRVPTTDDGVQLTEWTSIAAGARIFVFVPGRGEFVHRCATSVGSLLPLVIRLGETPRCDLLLSSARTDLPLTVAIHLRETGAAANAVEYRAVVARNDLRAGWAMWGVCAGTYEYEVGDAPVLARGSTAIAAGRNELQF